MAEQYEGSHPVELPLRVAVACGGADALGRPGHVPHAFLHQAGAPSLEVTPRCAWVGCAPRPDLVLLAGLLRQHARPSLGGRRECRALDPAALIAPPNPGREGSWPCRGEVRHRYLYFSSHNLFVRWSNLLSVLQQLL